MDAVSWGREEGFRDMFDGAAVFESQARCPLEEEVTLAHKGERWVGRRLLDAGTLHDRPRCGQLCS